VSMMSCNSCCRLIDTDFYPEFFREEFDDELLCDGCFESRLLDLEADAEPIDNNPLFEKP